MTAASDTIIDELEERADLWLRFDPAVAVLMRMAAERIRELEAQVSQTPAPRAPTPR